MMRLPLLLPLLLPIFAASFDAASVLQQASGILENIMKDPEVKINMTEIHDRLSKIDVNSLISKEGPKLNHLGIIEEVKKNGVQAAMDLGVETLTDNRKEWLKSLFVVRHIVVENRGVLPKSFDIDATIDNPIEFPVNIEFDELSMDLYINEHDKNPIGHLFVKTPFSLGEGKTPVEIIVDMSMDEMKKQPISFMKNLVQKRIPLLWSRNVVVIVKVDGIRAEARNFDVGKIDLREHKHNTKSAPQREFQHLQLSGLAAAIAAQEKKEIEAAKHKSIFNMQVEQIISKTNSDESLSSLAGLSAAVKHTSEVEGVELLTRDGHLTSSRYSPPKSWVPRSSRTTASNSDSFSIDPDTNRLHMYSSVGVVLVACVAGVFLIAKVRQRGIANRSLHSELPESVARAEAATLAAAVGVRNTGPLVAML